MLKVYIFNAALIADSGSELKTSIRGYFVCCRSQRHFKALLHDSLKVLGLELEIIERELEISEEVLSENLPHIHAVYRARGFGLELYHIKGKPTESHRSIMPLALADEPPFIRQAVHN